jgi:putative inorganic carbon (HCO3(-)) transporter
MIGLILSLLIGYGGALAALLVPLVGLFAYTCFSIVRPQQMFAWAGDVGPISQVVGSALIVGWIFKGGGNWELGRARTFAWLIVMYFSCIVASAIFASNAEVAWTEVIERAKIVVPFLIGLSLLTDRRWLYAYAWLLVLASGYVGFEMNFAYYVDGYNRAVDFSLLGDNNSFAISMVAAVGPALFLGLTTKAWWKRLVAFGCAALIMHTVIMTFSRGGLLALIITGVVVVVVMPKKPGYILPVILAAALGFRLAGVEVVKRFSTTFAAEEERDYSAQSRIDLWVDCLEIIRDHPFVGIGPRHFPLVAMDFGWTGPKSAHSLWLQTGAEIGVPGLIFLMAFYGTAMFAGLRVARSTTDPELAPLGMYVFSGLAGFAVAAQFVSLDGLEFPFYLTLVIAAAVRQVATAEAERAAALPLRDKLPSPPPVGMPSPAWKPHP